MKVLLYSGGLKYINKSGLGKAIQHQKEALSRVRVDYTTNPKEEYDILHINTYWLSSYFFIKRAKKKGKRIVFHAHSTEEDFKNSFMGSNIFSKVFKWWITKVYKLGDVIITPTEYSKDLLQGYKGLENKKIYAISNGIDLDKFYNDETLRNSFRNRWSYSNDDKVIIGIGLYIERKGIVDFVNLAKELPEYQFIWFGYSDPKLSTKKARDAVNTKLPNLKFAGYVEPSLIMEAMNGCDLYLFPTLEETEGIPVIEALATKSKALIRDIPVFNPWLKDGINIYKASNIDEFKSKIKGIVSNELPDLTDEGYKVAQERSLDNIGIQLKKVYEEVIDEI